MGQEEVIELECCGEQPQHKMPLDIKNKMTFRIECKLATLI